MNFFKNLFKSSLETEKSPQALFEVIKDQWLKTILEHPYPKSARFDESPEGLAQICGYNVMLRAVWLSPEKPPKGLEDDDIEVKCYALAIKNSNGWVGTNIISVQSNYTAAIKDLTRQFKEIL